LKKLKNLNDLENNPFATLTNLDLKEENKKDNINKIEKSNDAQPINQKNSPQIKDFDLDINKLTKDEHLRDFKDINPIVSSEYINPTSLTKKINFKPRNFSNYKTISKSKPIKTNFIKNTETSNNNSFNSILESNDNKVKGEDDKFTVVKKSVVSIHPKPENLLKMKQRDLPSLYQETLKNISGENKKEKKNAPSLFENFPDDEDKTTDKNINEEKSKLNEEENKKPKEVLLGSDDNFTFDDFFKDFEKKNNIHLNKKIFENKPENFKNKQVNENKEKDELDESPSDDDEIMDDIVESKILSPSKKLENKETKNIKFDKPINLKKNSKEEDKSILDILKGNKKENDLKKEENSLNKLEKELDDLLKDNKEKPNSNENEFSLLKFKQRPTNPIKKRKQRNSEGASQLTNALQNLKNKKLINDLIKKDDGKLIIKNMKNAINKLDGISLRSLNIK